MIVHEKLSATQFDAFIAQPEQLNRRFELIHGEIVEKMPTQLHGAIIGLLAYFLIGYLRQNPIGYALIEARYRLPGDSENDLIPDLSFVTHAHGALVTQGAAPYMPDLAVEAQSDGQSDKFMFDKAQVYLAHGTRLVWLLYSRRGIIEVLSSTDRQLLTLDDTLAGGDVLPGFSVSVRELFPAAGK